MSEHLDETVSALADGELTGEALRAAELHLTDCAACRALLDDVRAIKRGARALEDAPPARDLWAGIAARIAAQPVPGVTPIGAARSRRRRIAVTIPQLAAAAVALMAVSGGAAALLMHRGAPAALAATATPAAAAAAAAPLDPTPTITVSGPSGEAVASYDAAIKDLEATLQLRRSRLDTSTVRVVEQSLLVIDHAISQARAALAHDPDNLYLNTHLQNALGRKLDLLRHVATLPTVS